MKNSEIIISTEHDEEDGLGECEVRTLLVPRELHGLRLDRVLAVLLPEFSRSYLQQLIAAGALVTMGRVGAKASAKVLSGQQLQVELRPTAQSLAFVPQPMDIKVLFEDAHLRVIHKPAGLVVHPAPGNWSGTLLNGLLALDPGSSTVPRAGIVHRLDKDTSGLMVVARTRAAMDGLIRLIADRSVTREYVALGHKGWIGPQTVKVREPVGRDPRNRLRMAVVDLERSAGKPASTEVHLLDTTDQFCMVRCRLETGRTHQIRVHMAYLGHPLLSDPLYGGAAAGGMLRQALHARRLAFVHPMTGESLTFSASLPNDMVAAVAGLGLRYNEAE